MKQSLLMKKPYRKKKKVSQKTILLKEKTGLENKYLKEIVDKSFDSFIITNKKGIIEIVNKATCNLLEYKEKELIGKSIKIIFGKNIATDKCPSNIIEGVYIAKDGAKMPVLYSASIIYDDNKTKRIIYVARDITRRKHAAEKIKIFSDAIECAYNGFILTDREGNVTYANKSALDAFGYNLTEILKLNVSDFPADKSIAKNITEDISAKGKWSGEIIIKKRDKKEIPVLLNISAVKNNEGKTVGTMSIFIDITEHKLAEEKLKESEERYRGLFEDSPISLWEEDFTEVKKYINNLRSSGVQDFKKYFDANPEEISKCVNLIKVVDVNKITLGLYKSKSKEDFIANLGKLFRKESFEVFKEELVALASGKNVFESENATQTLTGQKKYVNLKLFVVPGAEETWSRVLLAINDITTKKQAEQELQKYHERLEELVEERTSELKTANEQLQDEINERKRAEVKLTDTMKELSRSNAELGQFASVVSHDLQEPLQVVTGYLKMLLQEYKDKLLDVKANEYISCVLESAKHMQRLISDLLMYSRAGARTRSFKQIDCELVLKRVLSNLKKSIDEAKAVITHSTLPIVEGDELQFIQLFQNLIGNAVKFHKKDSFPRIYISCEQKYNELVFSVEDNGIGIDSRKFNRIFGVFQRLHEGNEYPGTGIGLAICKKIIERRGGRIWIKSEPGKGTTIYFAIPARRSRE